MVFSFRRTYRASDLGLYSIFMAFLSFLAPFQIQRQEAAAILSACCLAVLVVGAWGVAWVVVAVLSGVAWVTHGELGAGGTSWLSQIVAPGPQH